jgi:DNA-binding beta-propeller fold protein YncE
VALGQSASRIAILSTVTAPPPGVHGVFENPGRTRLAGHFDPGYLAHQLMFTPDGRRVWITAADRSTVGVFDARTRRRLFGVAAGLSPQHIAMMDGDAYITSGYGSRIERVDLRNGRVLDVARAPYGSFELDAAGGYVVTASLLRGTMAIYDASLRRLRVRHVAASAEDVVLSGGK